MISDALVIYTLPFQLNGLITLKMALEETVIYRILMVGFIQELLLLNTIIISRTSLGLGISKSKKLPLIT